MKKLFKHFIPFLIAAVIASPAPAVTMNGCNTTAMQGCSVNSCDFNQIFGSDLIARYDATDANSITLNSSDVSQWDDLSGNGYHFVQPTAVDQPLYTPLNSAFNNLATVDFDGVTHNMESSPFMSALSGPFTVVMVALLNSGDHFFDTGNGSRNSFGKATADGTWEMYSDSPLTGSLAITSAIVFSLLFNDASSELKLNGVSDAIGNPGTSRLNGVHLGELNGGGFRGNINIAEFIVIDSILTKSVHNQVGNCLSSKYGLTWTDIP